jgi:acyl carrier protein
MDGGDALRDLLIEFFELPSTTPPEQLSQQAVAKWDSLAMVQLITELQLAFNVDFGLNEIEHLRSYSEIRECLLRKGFLHDCSQQQASLET